MLWILSWLCRHGWPNWSRIGWTMVSYLGNRGRFILYNPILKHYSQPHCPDCIYFGGHFVDMPSCAKQKSWLNCCPFAVHSLLGSVRKIQSINYWNLIGVKLRINFKHFLGAIPARLLAVSNFWTASCRTNCLASDNSRCALLVPIFNWRWIEHDALGYAQRDRVESKT